MKPEEKDLIQPEIPADLMNAAQIVNDYPENSRDSFVPQSGNAAQGFMGMTMMEQMLRAQGALPPQQGTLELMGLVPCAEQPPVPAAEIWQCACGAENTGKYCTNCGQKRKENAENGHS